MKKTINNKRKASTVSAIFFLLLMFAGCSTQTLTFVTSEEAEKINQSIDDIFGTSAGYSNSVSDFTTTPDIYTTYYICEIRNMLGEPLATDELQAISDYFSNNSNIFFFGENRYDNLMNIYFYCKFIHENNLITNNTAAIIDYIISIQLEDGSYALSSQDKLNFEDDVYGKQPIMTRAQNTRMALEILDLFNADFPNQHKTVSYITNCLTNFYELIGDLDISHIENLNICAELLDINNISYQELADELCLNAQEDYILLLENNTLNMIDINFYDTFISSHIDVKITKNQLYRYILDLQDSATGFFRLIYGDNINILPTYYAIKFMTQHELDIQYKNIIIQYSNRFHINGEGYTLIFDLPTGLENSYFSSQIKNIIKTKPDIDIKQMLEEYDDHYDNLTTLQMYYLLQICANQNELSNNSLDPIKPLLYRELETNTLSTLVDYKYYYYAMMGLELLDDEFSIDDYTFINMFDSSIIDELISSEDDEYNSLFIRAEYLFMQSELEHNLITSLEKNERIDLIQELLNELLYGSSTDYNLRYIYQLVSALTNYEADITIYSDDIHSILNKNADTSTGLYTISAENKAISLEASYYALELRKLLNI